MNFGVSVNMLTISKSISKYTKSILSLAQIRPAVNFGLSAIAVLFAAGLVLTPAVAQADGEVVATNGWFSEAQVARGQALYETRCATCHGSEIADGWGLWDGTVQELVDMIKSMGMPADNPGGLPPQQYLDIASYIMHNGGGLAFGDEVLAGSDAVNQAKRAE